MSGRQRIQLNRALRLLPALPLAMIGVAGCGDDGDGSGSGGSSASSAAGTTSNRGGSGGTSGASAGDGGSAGKGNAGTSGSTVGGSSGGGTNGGTSGGGDDGGSNAGGSGNSSSGTHCTPGEVLIWPEQVYENFGGPMATCMDYQTSPDGVPDSPVILVTDIALPEPLEPASPYAFSIVIGAAPDDGSVTIEFWGSDAKCGFGAEQLYSAPMLEGTLCVELDATATHQHLLMVWRGEGSLGHNNVAICPGGACE